LNVADPKPDYAALARKWLEKACGGPLTCPECTESLAALLERLTGEAKREGYAEALEQAALECERVYDQGLGGAHQGEQCIRTAKAIRALIEPEAPKA